MKHWYEIENLAGDALRISLHDEIGIRGIPAGAFMDAIDAQGSVSNIDMSIHSPGGNFIEGLAIYNYLKDHPAKVHTHVRGLAGSASSLVLMAGDTRTMPEDSYIMIHRMQFSGGGQQYESDDLRDIAATMDKFEQSAVNVYQRATGVSEDVLKAKMAATSWIGAREALGLGFIDAVTEPLGIAAKATEFSRYFEDMPFLQSAEPVDGIQNIKDFERHLRDAGGFTRGQATALASRAKALFKQGDPVEAEAKQIQQLSAALMRFKVPESLT